MRHDRVVVYRAKNGEWRWRYVRKNGRTMADSAEGYVQRGRCVAAARYLFPTTDIVVV